MYRILYQNSPYRDSLISKSADHRVHLAPIESEHGVYSKIPILRTPLGLSKSGLKDHFWTVPKVVSNQRYNGCRK